MPVYYHREIDSYTLGIGIKGKLSSFCGAVKRFENQGIKWNGLLSLKEQCARRIALIKNEQLKCFVMAYLSSTLFKYVTNDIFNLQRSEFQSNYPRQYHLCDECSVTHRGKRQFNCSCPRMKTEMKKLNEYFAKRINIGNNTKQLDKLKKFELIYKVPDDETGAWTGSDGDPICYFLYLSPCEECHSFDTNIIRDHEFPDFISNQAYKLVNGQASIEEKLLFVDVMRYFGGFQIDHQQAQLISCYRSDIRH